jgi:hypothetical protein
MDDAPDRRAERLARRVRFAVRLVFYPLALALIVVAWQRYHGDAASGHGTEIAGWQGTTSQGERIGATTGDARLVYLDTHLRERCSDGSSFSFHWVPGEARFVQRGADVHGRTSVAGRSTSGELIEWDNQLWARLGDHPRGSLRAQLVFPNRPGGVRCDSGPVSFALERGPVPKRPTYAGAR